ILVQTEEVEHGKFVRKCEKTEQILKDCIGRPVEVVKSDTEFTEEYVTNEMVKRSFYFESQALNSFTFWPTQ
ncbi:fra a 1-associated protein-like, partial [Telopea speciosissima]|uniref:fra a 1-associated protein-like n=1 Tax=Telopea speciosissima TaxID=54955 RepID=UPI001CC37BFE